MMIGRKCKPKWNTFEYRPMTDFGVENLLFYFQKKTEKQRYIHAQIPYMRRNYNFGITINSGFKYKKP